MDTQALIAQLRATQATHEATIAQIEAVIVALQAEAGQSTAEGDPPPCPKCHGQRGFLRAISGPDSIVCNRCGEIKEVA